MLYIFSQVLVGMGMTLDISSRTMKNKKWILLLTTTACLFYAASYLCLKSPLSAIANGVNIVRGIIYMLLDRHHKKFVYYLPPMLVLGVISIAVAAIFWQGPMDLLVIGATLLALVVLALKNTLQIRLGLACAGTLWLFYNLHLHAYVNMANDVANITVVLFATLYYNVFLPRKQLQNLKTDENEKKVKQILAIIKTENSRCKTR